MLKAELEKRSVYGFMEVGIRNGKDAFVSLMQMFESYKDTELDIQKAFMKQTISIGDSDNKISLSEAILTREFYEVMLDSSLEAELPDLYELAMADYLQLSQAIEAHITTHTTKGKKKIEKKIKREETDNTQSSEAN